VQVVGHSVRVVGACPSRGLVAEGRRAWRANSHGVCGLRGSRDEAEPGIPAVSSRSRAVQPGGVEVQDITEVSGVCDDQSVSKRGVVLV